MVIREPVSVRECSPDHFDALLMIFLTFYTEPVCIESVTATQLSETTAFPREHDTGTLVDLHNWPLPLAGLPQCLAPTHSVDGCPLGNVKFLWNTLNRQAGVDADMTPLRDMT